MTDIDTLKKYVDKIDTWMNENTDWSDYGKWHDDLKKDSNIINTVYNLVINDKIPQNAETTKNEDLLFFLAMYYYKKDFKTAEPYLLKQCVINDRHAMLILAIQYYNDNQFMLAKKFCQMAISFSTENIVYEGNRVLTLLGLCSKCLEQYDDMKKYWLMAIEQKDDYAMFLYGEYFQDKQKYESMEKYYLMAIEHGRIQAMEQLGKYYKSIKKWKLMEKYLLMAIGKENIDSLKVLCDHYIKNKHLVKLFDLISTNKEFILKHYNFGETILERYKDYELVKNECKTVIKMLPILHSHIPIDIGMIVQEFLI